MLLCGMLLTALCVTVSAADAAPEWKAGVAAVDITPPGPLWMAGYAARTAPADGTIHPLWVKALALEDAAGNRALLVTSDILGYPKAVSDRLLARFEKEAGLRADQVILNSSHTHSGPVVDGSLMCIYPLDDAERAKIRAYTGSLEEKTVAAGLQALAALAPARLEAGAGVTRFAVNRRNNKEAEIASVFELKGPSDHSVPVLRVTGADGAERAVLFGYACHNTTLDTLRWCGDYAGFAQLAVEEAHPGAVAMFFQGCGGNQNPLPRRKAALARQYGRELGAAVDAALAGDLRPLPAKLATALAVAEIVTQTPKTRAELEQIAATASGYMKEAALALLRDLDTLGALKTAYDYPVHCWNLGGLPLVALTGEVVVDYTVHAKALLGNDAVVLGYCYDQVSYVPTAAIVREGGYEGESSQFIYGWAAKWDESIEERIVTAMRAAAKNAGFEASGE